MATPAVRISRRMANEVGISAEQLQQLMTCSPSPKKGIAEKSLNATKETLQNCLAPKNEKENMVGVAPLPEDSFSALTQKKINSIDTANFSMKKDGEIYVPRLQLKSVDQNIALLNSSSVKIPDIITKRIQHEKGLSKVYF